MRKSKKFNRIHIEGKTKGRFLKKSVSFEIVIYFTNFKKVIFYIYTERLDLNDKRLKIDFKIGDNIQLAKDWAERYAYEIKFERDK
jgi:hypothetical protein